jgi:hypothetical protein
MKKSEVLFELIEKDDHVNEEEMLPIYGYYVGRFVTLVSDVWRHINIGTVDDLKKFIKRENYCIKGYSLFIYEVFNEFFSVDKENKEVFSNYYDRVSRGLGDEIPDDITLLQICYDFKDKYIVIDFVNNNERNSEESIIVEGNILYNEMLEFLKYLKKIYGLKNIATICITLSDTFCEEGYIDGDLFRIDITRNDEMTYEEYVPIDYLYEFLKTKTAT